MVGAIRKRDILAHPVVAIECFGPLVFLRTLLARADETFLALATQGRAAGVERVLSELGRCRELELQAERFYHGLAQRFGRDRRLVQLFRELAAQEATHAEMLALCERLAAHDARTRERLKCLAERLTRAEREIAECRSAAQGVRSAYDALKLVLRLESSEITRLFDAAVGAAASASPFVRQVRAFGKASTSHLGMICQRVAALEPRLARECALLRAKAMAPDSSPHTPHR